MVGEILGALIIMLLIIFCLFRLEIRKVNALYLALILSLQIGLIIVVKSFQLSMNVFLFLILHTLLSICYVVIDKKLKIEDRFIVVDAKNKKATLKMTIDVILGIFIVVIRWLEILAAIILPLSIYARILDSKYFYENLSSFGVMLFVLSIFPMLFDSFSFNLNIKKLYVYLVLGMVFLVGLFSSKWWTGISLLSTIIGMALSEDFFRKNTTISLHDDFDDSFFKIIVPCTTLLVYLCLIFIQDILPRELVIKLLQKLSNVELDPKSFGGKVTISLFLGILEIILFILAWGSIGKVIEKSTILNHRFKKQFRNTKRIIRDLIKKKTIRKTE
jgi:hypothetical protein